MVLLHALRMAHLEISPFTVIVYPLLGLPQSHAEHGISQLKNRLVAKESDLIKYPKET